MSRLVMISVIRHDIFGVGQVMNMASGIINATASVTIETVPIHFYPDEPVWMKKRLQGRRVGEIGASKITHLSPGGDCPM